jgi:hypothetical protein
MIKVIDRFKTNARIRADAGMAGVFGVDSGNCGR